MRLEELKLALILMMIVSVAVATLTYINSKTRPLILENQKMAEELALKQVLPEGTTVFEQKETAGFKYFVGYFDPDKSSVSGYAFQANGSGYSSVIKTMVGVNTELKISGMKIVSQQETPGLGTKVAQTGKYQGRKQLWTDQFNNLSASEIVLDKENKKAENPIEAISGATISSKAVTHSVVEGFNSLREVVQQESEAKP